MRRKYVLYTLVLAGLALLLAGCGGSQNPIRFDGSGTPFWNGLWDGFTMVIAFIVQIFNRRYGIYGGGSIMYNFGYVLGAAIWFRIIYVGFGWGWSRRTVRVVRH